MEERSEPERVEVELTSDPVAAHGRRGRRGGRRGRRELAVADVSTVSVPPDRPVVGGAGSGPESDPGSGAEIPAGDDVVRTESIVAPTVDSSRRAIAVGLGAGVAGLTLGWLLGGSSGSTEQAATATVSTSVPAADDDADADDEDGEVAAESTDDALTPIETVRPTTTVRPRRTTTTVAFPPAEITDVSLHPALEGADFRIVGISGTSGTAMIDLATATMTRQDWLVGSIEPFGAVVGDGWFVAASPSSGSVRVFTEDGQQTNSDVGDPWSLLWIEGTDLFWRSMQEPFAAGVDGYEQVDLTGEPTGPTIDGHGTWPAGVDPAGGVLTVAQGKTYSLREEGVEFVGSGELVAISADHAAFRSCDEQLVCGLFVVDRATGERREAPVEPGIVPVTQFYFGAEAGAVSPDGGAVSFFAPTDSGVRLLVVDVDTGAVTELAANIGGPAGLSWSPDGRFGIFLLGATPQLYDRESGEIEPVGDDLGSWRTVEVRPGRAPTRDAGAGGSERDDVDVTAP